MEQLSMDKNLVISNRGKEVIFNTYNRFPIAFKKGEGMFLFDMNDEKYLDFVSGIAVNCLGYNHPKLNETIAKQSTQLIHCSNLYWNEPMVELAEKLVKLSGLNKTFFCNSGAEAIEAALKLARIKGVTKKGSNCFEVISMKQSFHGRTFGAISATGQPKYHEGFYPLLPGMKHVKFNDFEDLQSIISENTCAILIEPIQGEGGIIPADKEYLKKVRKLCSELNITLIFDEIQCGVGRTGKFFAFENYEVIPDIVVLAKGLAGGIPIGAMIANDETANYFKPGKHASTFGGNPFACSVANAVIDEVVSILAKVNENSLYLVSALNVLCVKYKDLIVEHRGLGFMQGIEFQFPVKSLIDFLIENNIVTVSAGDYVLRIVPPLICSKSNIDVFFDALNNYLFNFEIVVSKDLV